MTPEILTSIRVLLTALGGYFVGKGHIDAALAEAIVGAVLIMIPAVWGVWLSNRPGSREAVRIAERVAHSDSPGASHIVEQTPPPPGTPERRHNP